MHHPKHGGGWSRSVVAAVQLGDHPSGLPTPRPASRWHASGLVAMTRRQHWKKKQGNHQCAGSQSRERSYLDQINEGAKGARREAAYISTANMPSIPVRAKFVGKVSFTTAITACAFFIGAVFGHQHFSATSSRSLAKPTVDLAALEATIDVRDLPRQKLPLDVYQ